MRKIRLNANKPSSLDPRPLLVLGIATICLPFVACSIDPFGTAPASTSQGSTSSSSSTSSTSSGNAGEGGMAGASSSNTGGMAGVGGIGGSGGAGGAGGGGECMDDGQGSCEPWWDTNYTRRRRVVITPKGNPQSVPDFPWLLRIDSTHIDYSKTKPAGADLRFVADDGTTVLAHEIEAWNEGNTSYVWVRIPSIPQDAMGTVILWMYYGNTVNELPKLLAPSDTWNANFVSVHHLHADFADSTSGKHDGTSSNLPTLSGGQIANGATFDGVDDHVILPKEADFDFENSLTVSAWITVPVFTKQYEALVTKGDNSWRLHRYGTTPFAGFSTHAQGGAINNLLGTINMNDNMSRHVAIVYTGSKKRIYNNGELDQETDYNVMIQKNDFDVCFGNNLQNTDRQFKGQMDEVRIARVGRSPSWIALEYHNMINDQLTSWSNDQLPPP